MAYGEVNVNASALTDTTLTQEGIPADAKAVGEQKLSTSGGTMTGQIKRSVNTSYIRTRDYVPLSNPQTGTNYRPVVGVKCKDGYWAISTYSDNNLRFAYTSDSDYNAGKNQETAVILPAEAGTILTTTSAFNYVYPVGSIYMSTSSTSPASLFGGS